MTNLKDIIEDTKNKKLHWIKDGSSFAFIAFSEDNSLYSVSEEPDGNKVFDAFDENGETVCHLTSAETKDTDWPDTLYSTIVEMDADLRESVSPMVSLTKIKECIVKSRRLNIRNNESFNYIQSDITYIEPNFSQQTSFEGKTPLPNAQVIAISASGATGKTALSEYLSSEMGLPVFSMEKHDAVGSNSLLGMLFNTLPLDEFSAYIQDLRDGKTTMIIDALDEGYVKTNNPAFESFLNDLVSIASANNGMPFIIMGRNSILEYATIYLEEHGVKVSLLQIEPFVRKKAEDFIDVMLTEKRGKEITYKKEYKEARDYILNSLEAFFTSESDISKKQRERFIGYAPVLLSIATLMHAKEQNYYQLKSDLEKSNAKNAYLIRNIIEMILVREQGKVENEIRTLLHDMKYNDVDKVMNRAYGISEQCARLLCSVNGKDYKEDLTEDALINEKYEEIISRWFLDHPFMANNKIQNIVFEGYVVSRLVGMEKYRDDVITYLDKNWRNSYILFDLYNIMAGEGRRIDRRFAKYLIDSYKATEKGYNRHDIELICSKNSNGGIIECELSFEKLGSVEYAPYTIILQEDEPLEMPSALSNIYVEAPICIAISNKQAELSPMINITCRKIILSSEDILITPSLIDDSIVLECEEFEGDTQNGKLQNVSNNGKVKFDIMTDSNVYFPFASYKKSKKKDMPEDSKFIDKYQKMRRTIVQFRAHSKGALAKYKEKIDNRIGNTEAGKKVIDGLLREGILEEKGQMYFINDEVMSEKLGLGYAELRTYEVNGKVKLFLNSI